MSVLFQIYMYTSIIEPLSDYNCR